MNNLEVGTTYQEIIIIYQYLGTIFDCNYHEDEDWVEYTDLNLKQALHLFWDKYSDDGSGFCSRSRHRKDFKLLNVLAFNSFNECEEWQQNWWKKEHKSRLGIIV